MKKAGVVICLALAGLSCNRPAERKTTTESKNAAEPSSNPVTGDPASPAASTASQTKSSGLYPVRVNSRHGYIDRTGKVVVQPRFGRAIPFSEGLAAASEPGGKWGYIDSTGTYAIAPQYDTAAPFKEGLAAVQFGAERLRLHRPKREGCNRAQAPV